MASAVLASRNEPYWGEHKVYMRKYTNNNSNNSPHLNRFGPNANPSPSFITNPNPNPSLSRQIHHSSTEHHWRQNNETSTRLVRPSAYNDATMLNRKGISSDDRKEMSHGDYVTFDLSTYSRRELKQLKKRLISELEQVRSLRNRIETRDLVPRTDYPVPLFSGSYGTGREMSLPPAPQLNHGLESSAVVATPSKEKRAPNANQNHQNSQFDTGKRKNSKVLGQKRGLPFSLGKGQKRPMALDSPIENIVVSMMRRCAQILSKLMKHKHGWVFNKPVDVVGLGLRDYRQIIKHPMDLGTVKSRLDKHEYGTPLDFASDVRLTFNNALTYNTKGQDVHIMAETLLAMFEQMFNPAYQRYEVEHRRVSVSVQPSQKTWVPPAVVPRSFSGSSPRVQSTLSNPQPVQASAAPVLTAKPVVTPGCALKLPKPKAKDPNKRQMSFEEKAKLGMSLQHLPTEKMDQLMQVIKKRNTHLARDGDDIELDIEIIDNETLWELDRFVSYHKRSVSKTKRQEFINNAISAQIIKSPLSDPASEAAAKNKTEDAVEEDVDIGEEIPVNNFPPVEIEKDAVNASSSRSSSSSSSSGSSSSSCSDSDSGSSSESDSDDDSVQSPFVEAKEPSII